MDYARALVEHPMWRWEPGMGIRTLDGKTDVVAWVDAENVNAATPCGAWIRYRIAKLASPAGLLPNINHPATKGWLLHMLREATGDAQATTGKSAYFDTWTAFYGAGETRADAYKATEGEALAAALLAVWGQAA